VCHIERTDIDNGRIAEGTPNATAHGEAVLRVFQVRIAHRATELLLRKFNTGDRDNRVGPSYRLWRQDVSQRRDVEVPACSAEGNQQNTIWRRLPGAVFVPRPKS